MNAQHWLPLVACAGQLGLAALASSRAGKSPLAVPLSLLCFGLFSWNFATLGHRVSGEAEWRYLDVAMSPLTMPLTLNFVAAFVGRRRELRRFLSGVWLVFGALSLLSLSAFVLPSMRSFAGSPAWASIFLVSAVGSIAAASVLLHEHLGRARESEERLRTRLVHAALLIGGTLSLTELLADIGLAVPRGGSMGAVVAAAVLAVVTLRFGLLESELSTRAVIYSVATGSLAVSAYLGVFYFLQANAAMVLLGTVTVTLGSIAVTRQIVYDIASQRERLRKLAVLGRFSAQMAHDLKNPIAAVKGAAQFLKEELQQGRSLTEQAEFIDLICEQVDRLHEVVDEYHRLGKVETIRKPVDLSALAGRIIAAERLCVPRGCTLTADLASDLPECLVDEALISRALQNLLRNSFEAISSAGTVTVRTRLHVEESGRSAVVVSVEDTGAGMDPRAAERVFDDFFTTKRQGTGLGLFFVKRVVEAHAGRVWLESHPGLFTKAHITIPVCASREQNARKTSHDETRGLALPPLCDGARAAE